MVGRGHEREEVLRLLDAHGVVTLTGPGGVGKTRLALDIAAGWEESEVSVVALGAVARPERVAQAVASRLGLRLTGDVHSDDVALALADRRAAAGPRQLRARRRGVPHAGGRAAARRARTSGCWPPRA